MSGKVLLIEAYYGGSHKAFIDILTSRLSYFDLLTLPAKKWHWRARTAGLYFAQAISKDHCYKRLLCSSVLNLTELVALRPDLQRLEKYVYFHENQLNYPVQECKDRDFQYGYNEILTSLTADHVLFNSEYNRQSFLTKIPTFLNKMPSEMRPNSLAIVSEIRDKSTVLYFPVDFENIIPPTPTEAGTKLRIVWPHRWEHDKGPELFFNTLIALADLGLSFELYVLGETYGEAPEIFSKAQRSLGDKIMQWGFVPSKEKYYEILHSADVAVSTASHEFFGVSMIEATYYGCYPVCPNALVYPEIFPAQCLYNTEKQLFKILKNFCKHPQLARDKRRELIVDFERFAWKNLQAQYVNLLTSNMDV